MLHELPTDLNGLPRLSPREDEVLALAAQGLTNPQIAVRTGTTVHNVKFHLASIYRKLGVSNRTEAAVLYLQSGQSAVMAQREQEVNGSMRTRGD